MVEILIVSEMNYFSSELCPEFLTLQTFSAIFHYNIPINKAHVYTIIYNNLPFVYGDMIEHCGQLLKFISSLNLCQ